MIESKPILFEFGGAGSNSPPVQQFTAASTPPEQPTMQVAPIDEAPEALTDTGSEEAELLDVDGLDDDFEVLDDPSTYKTGDFAPPPPSLHPRVSHLHRKSAGSSPVPLRGRRGSDNAGSMRLSSNSEDISILDESSTSSPRSDLEELTEVDSEEEIGLNEIDEMFDFLKQTGIRIQPQDTSRAVRATVRY